MTHSHSGTVATHISLDTSWRSHANMSAFCGRRYWRVRMRSPLPHDTEHADHAPHALTAHSAAGVMWN